MPFNVINGTDDRVPVPAPHAWPYTAHGNLSLSFGGKFRNGSGVLVGRRHVLTAAHNIFPRLGPAPSAVFFNAAQHGPHLPMGSEAVVDAFAHPRWTKLGDPDWDFALLLLDGAVGMEAGFYEMSALAQQQLETMVFEITGYPQEKPETMWRDRGRLSKVLTERLLYSIDTSKGQSGSAIWCPLQGGKPTVTGVHTFGEVTGNEGVRLTAEKISVMRKLLAVK